MSAEPRFGFLIRCLNSSCNRSIALSFVSFAIWLSGMRAKVNKRAPISFRHTVLVTFSNLTTIRLPFERNRRNSWSGVLLFPAVNEAARQGGHLSYMPCLSNTFRQPLVSFFRSRCVAQLFAAKTVGVSHADCSALITSMDLRLNPISG